MTAPNSPRLTAFYFLVCVAGFLIPVALVGLAHASEHIITVKIPVNKAGLDVNTPDGAKRLYRRVAFAADLACTGGNRVGLERVDNYRVCYEESLAAAVRSANLPRLTQVYLAKHSPSNAAAPRIASVLGTTQ
jgi:UrcA family protein